MSLAVLDRSRPSSPPDYSYVIVKSAENIDRACYPWLCHNVGEGACNGPSRLWKITTPTIQVFVVPRNLLPSLDNLVTGTYYRPALSLPSSRFWCCHVHGFICIS